MATIKQKLAFKKVLKGMTLTQAMSDVNYAPSTAKTTGKLTRSKGWQELIDKHISEEALTKVHADGLRATRGEEIDYAVRHKYLETGYKIRGRLKEDKPDVPQFNINIYTPEQRRRIAERELRESESQESSHRLLDSNESEV